MSCVNHSGDSDSTGAVCGNIMGVLLGRSAIPVHFADKLELRDVIEEMPETSSLDASLANTTITALRKRSAGTENTAATSRSR